MAEVMRQRVTTIVKIMGLLMGGRIIPDRRSLKSDEQSEDRESGSCYTAGRFEERQNALFTFSGKQRPFCKSKDRHEPPGMENNQSFRASQLFS